MAEALVREPAAPRGAAPSAVVWINRRRAIVAAISDTGRVSTCQIFRGSLSQRFYLVQVVRVIGDRERVVILGPSSVRAALERAYVARFPRAGRLVDVEPAPLASPEELLGRLRILAS